MNRDPTKSAVRSLPGDPFDEGARSTLITEEQFLALLQPQLAEFFAPGFERLPEDSSRWPKRYFSVIAEKADELESFLDDFDARNNRRFSFLVELVASLRGFASVANILHHIRIRFPKYQIQLGVDDMEGFHGRLRQAQRFVHGSVSRLLNGVRHELSHLGLRHLEPGEDSGPVGEESIRRHLPHDIDEAMEASDEAKVAAVLTRLLEVADSVRRAENLWPGEDLDSLHRFVEDRYDETKARALESKVHNIQSAYDTHIKFTAIESSQPELRVVRGHISLTLHLLEAGTLLIHFYERHEDVVQQGGVRERIAALVDRKEVLNHAVNFALYHACRVLTAARPMVAALLPHFVQHREIVLRIPGGGMLHARPLSLIVSIVRHHGTAVDLVIDGESSVANSIMGLILFVGRHTGAQEVRFRGDRRPLEDLRLLFEHGLGENGMDHFPEELWYLRDQR